MNFFDKMVGKKQASTNPAEAIQSLREIEDMLTKKQEFLEAKIKTEFLAAKRNVSINKQVALKALRRKRRFENQLQQIDKTLTTIEMQRETLESANTNTTVLRTMKNAADALKKSHADVDVDQVHNMLDDIADQQDLAFEIADAIANPVGFSADVSEDELDRELEALEEELLEKKLLEVPRLGVLPDVSSEKVAVSGPSGGRKEASDEDLKKLEQWAS